MGGAVTMTAPNRYGIGLDPDPVFSTADDSPPPIASVRQSVIDRPVITTDNEIRCQGKVAMANGTHKVCNKLLANMASRPWEIQCPRCRAMNASQPPLSAPGPAPTPSPSEE